MSEALTRYWPASTQWRPCHSKPRRCILSKSITAARARVSTRQPQPQPTHDTQPFPEGYLSRAETATFTRLNIQTIDAAINAGELRASKVGRRVLIRKPDIFAWLDRRQK